MNNDGFMDLRIVTTRRGDFESRVYNDVVYYGSDSGLKSGTVSFVQQPYFLSPAPKSDGSPTPVADDTPTLKWTDVVGASGGYDLFVYDKAAGLAVVAQITLTTNSFTTKQLTVGRVYQAFVRGELSDGTPGPFSAPLEFIVIADQSPDTSGDLVAKWAALSGAASYDLVAYDVQTGKEVANVKGIAATSFDLSTTLEGIDKFSVYTKANFITGATGNWVRVEVIDNTDDDDPVDETPSVPTLLGPAGDDIGLNPRITWTESANAVTYEMLIYNIDNGQQFLSKTGLEFESYTIPDSMSSDTNYQVFVRGSKGSEKSAWSSPLQFKTAGSASALQAPDFGLSSGVQLSNRPTIGWTASANAINYEVLLYNKNTGQLVEQAKGIRDTQFTPSEALDSSGSFQMFVRAVNRNGQESAWSTSLEFTIRIYRVSALDLVFASSFEVLAV